MGKVSVCVYVCVCVCVCVCVIWPNLSINIWSTFFYPSQYSVGVVSMLLWFIVNYFHIFTMFLLFLCFLLTVMLGMLAPFPKPHRALPTSMSGYVVDTAISIQPIQKDETAIWTVGRLPHKSIKMPLSRQPTDVVTIKILTVDK